MWPLRLSSVISNAIDLPASLWTGVFSLPSFSSTLRWRSLIFCGFPARRRPIAAGGTMETMGRSAEATARAAQWGGGIGWGLIGLGSMEISGVRWSVDSG